MSESDPYASAVNRARGRYEGMSKAQLLEAQAQLREQYKGRMPTHDLVASLEVVYLLLKEMGEE